MRCMESEVWPSNSECTVLECKFNVFIRKNIVLKKKICAGAKIFSAKISGKCNVTGAIFIGNFHKNDGNYSNFQRTICNIFPSVMQHALPSACMDKRAGQEKQLSHNSPLPLAPSAVHVVSLIRCIDHQTFCSTYSWPKCLNFRVLVTWDISRCPGQLFCMVLYGTIIFFPLQIRNVRFRRFAISVIFRFSKKIGSVHTP